MYEKLNNLLVLLCRTISTRKLYFTDHPKVKAFSKDFVRQLRAFFDETGLERLFVGIIDGNLIFEGRNLVGPSIVGRQLINFADKLQCGGFSFNQNTTAEEFKALLDLTSELIQPVSSITEARELLVAKNIFNIEIAHHYIDPSGPMAREDQAVWHGQDSGNFLQSPTLIYQALFDAVEEAHGNVLLGNEIDIDNTRSVSEYMLHFFRTQFADLMQHVYYPDYESYTVGHSVRVSAIAVFLANSFKWHEDVLISLATAALLHDVGKSKIDDEILYKPGRLSSEEFSIMMDHSRKGAEILMEQKNVSSLDVAAAWGHHIRHDGGGYPEKPEWAVRHPIISLLQICDAFEALTASRPYKPPLSPHMAYSIMLQDKGGFHPTLLASFIAAIGIYPPGNIIRLSDGSKGLVLGVGSAIERPRLRVTHEPHGAELSPEDQYLIDLEEGKNTHLYVEELLIPGVAGSA